MGAPGEVDPYAEIASFYDAEFDGACADVATFARGLDGCRRVLVLGCGTGRVSEGLNAPDRDVVGVDLSAPMIARARARGSRVRYEVGDMTALPTLGTFDAALIPNAAFSFLPTRAAQLRCLQGLRACLTGPVWIDVPMPDFTLLGVAHSPESPAWAGRVDGVDVHRTREVFRDPVRQTLLLRDRYRFGGVCRVSDLHLRLIFPAELEWMLEAAGFYADAMFGDHAGGAVRAGCDRLLVRALS